MSNDSENPEDESGQAAGQAPRHNRAGHDIKQMAALERQEEVCRLRMLGWSFDEIAQELGYKGRAGAHYAFQAAMKNYEMPNADEFRSMMLSGWLQVWRANLPAASGVPDEVGRPTVQPDRDAVENLHKASGHIESMTGLTIKRLEVTGKDGAPLVPTDLSKVSDDDLEALARGTSTG